MLDRALDVQHVLELLDAQHTRVRAEPADEVILPEELPTTTEALDEELEFFCPVCGIDLERSNFDTPERDYYCPFCSTRQMPVVVAAP